MEEIKKVVASAARELFGASVEPELSRPDEEFGDYSTNVALKLGAETGKPPREIAETLASKLRENPSFSKVEVAGPGFINLSLTDSALLSLAAAEPVQGLASKVVVAEYSDPNPFKVLHVGHLYDGIVGEAIAKLCETAGATVHRVNFGGDVGLHVAKTMWAILKQLGGEHPDKLEVSEKERANWLSSRYVEGTEAHEDSDAAKKEIIELNQRIYQIHETNDQESPLAKIYWTTRQWSYDYFNAFYDRVGTHFEKYYPESLTAPIGLKAVNEQLEKGLFEKSDGAVVFKGEVDNLHTRVFINSEGLPTYETKDIGLALSKWEDYHFDRNIIITGNEIVEYMKVVLAALVRFAPEIAERTVHLTHGMVKLSGGSKMSSRKGNILKAVDVLDMTADAVRVAGRSDEEPVVLAAVKYAFLKQRLGGDIIYEPDESVALEGNSGPYLQYAHARARSILAKADKAIDAPKDFQPDERSLVRKISEYSEVVDKAVTELMPHHICTYLYELAQVFNRFYEKNRVIGDDREANRLWLAETYADTLKKGLGLLNITAPDKM